MSNINSQYQMDKPFLISDTPGAVAQHFNRVARIDKIDTSLKLIQKWLREVSNDLAISEANQKKYDLELKQYEYLDKFEIDLDVLDEMNSNQISLSKRVSGLGWLVSEISRVFENKKAMEPWLELSPLVEEVESYREAGVEVDQQVLALNKLIKQHQRVSGELTVVKRMVVLVDYLAVFDLLRADGAIVQTDTNNLLKLVKSIEEKEQDIEKAQKDVTTKEYKLKVNMPRVCPLCDTDLSKA